MKYLLKNIACAIMLLSLFNCTTEPVEQSPELSITTQSQDINLDTPSVNDCNDASPKVRIINNGSINVNFEIYDVDGAMVDQEHDIETNYTSDWTDLPIGEITFAVSNINADKIVVLDADTCMIFELLVDTDNQLTYSVSSGL